MKEFVLNVMAQLIGYFSKIIVCVNKIISKTRKKIVSIVLFLDAYNAIVLYNAIIVIILIIGLEIEKVLGVNVEYIISKKMAIVNNVQTDA